MSFHLLGTAAGGGFPQWNCACPICMLSRREPALCPPRLHLQAAFGGDGWFLINASPDLLLQIRSTPQLQPEPGNGSRNTPIRGVILTSADLDQTLGLLLLREFQPLTVYATRTVRQVLEANSFFRMMERVPRQLTWIEMVPGTPFQAGDALCTPVPMAGSLPYYASHAAPGGADEPGQATLGLIVEQHGKRIAYTPGVPEITAELKQLYSFCDVILVDGTFWSDTELQETHSGTPLARAIGHVPMSGEQGTIAMLADVTRPRKLFVHINNTNPVLDRRTEAFRALRAAGWELAEDGWQIL